MHVFDGTGRQAGEREAPPSVQPDRVGRTTDRSSEGDVLGPRREVGTGLAIRHPNGPTAVNVLNGRLFFLSRVDDDDEEIFFRLDSYNPATGEWRRMPDPPVQAIELKAAVLAGKLYVMGGLVRRTRPGALPGDVDPIADVQVFDGQE